MFTLILSTATTLSVYQRMLAAKSSERTRQAYADDLRQFEKFISGHPQRAKYHLAST